VSDRSFIKKIPRARFKRGNDLNWSASPAKRS